jgi:hypothetical protein
VKCLFQKLTIVGVVLALLSGCATTGTTPGSSSTSDDANNTKAQGTAIGVVAGAILGGVAGKLLGGDNKSVATGAIIGAALGGAGGYALGSTVASRKQKYANEEDSLDGEIQVFTRYNSDLEEFNKQTATKIQTFDQQIAELNAISSTSKVRASKLQNTQNEIKKWISEAEQRKSSLNKELAALDQDQQRMSKMQDQTKVAKLNQQVNVLKKNIVELDSSNVQMAKSLNSITLRK